MNRNELKTFILDKIKLVDLLHLTIFIKKKNPSTYQEVINSTKYLENCYFTERLYHIVNDLYARPKCGCDKDLKFYDFNRGYKEYCSLKCLTSSSKRNEKIKKIWEIRSSEEINKITTKTKQTKLKKYNSTTYVNPKKSQFTKLKKYGNKNYCNSEQIKKNKFKTFYKSLFTSNRLKDVVVPLFNVENYNGVRPQKYEFSCVKCGNIFYDTLCDGFVPRCLKCYPYLKGTSKMELEVVEWLSKKIEVKNRQKFYYNKQKFYEIDIFIPSKNIGIEMDGLYWHSEVNGKKNRKYHIDKTNFFKKKNIQIIHIFEDEWRDKQNIIKSLILSKMGMIENKIYARNCQVKMVNKNETKIFLFDNHIQANTISKINVGLYFQDELVSLMTFGKPRYNKNYDWEMLRFCNKIEFSIVGGASKMLSYFRKNNLGGIISYADLRFSTGSLYKTLGFELLHQSDPNYFYLTKTNQRVHRQQFQKHKLKTKLSIFDPNLTEWQNMQLNGYDRIWDCGNLVFGLKE